MTQWKTHSSYLKHTKAKFEYDGDYQTADYEQLEVSDRARFGKVAPATAKVLTRSGGGPLQLIGDGLIRFVVMDKMMELYPRLTPGGATVSRLDGGLACDRRTVAKTWTFGLQALLSKLQSEEMLASISVYYQLPDQLRADPSILRGLQANPRVQCDLFEAFVGALYKQEGFRTARKWVRDVFHKVIIDEYEQLKATFATTKLAVDPFVKLHEYCQAKRITPDYDFHVEGRSPDQTFTCTMTVRHLSVAGRGRNKQQAKNASVCIHSLRATRPRPRPVGPAAPPTEKLTLGLAVFSLSPLCAVPLR